MIGVLCCNEIADHPIQAVATWIVKPLVRYAGATVLLVPAAADATDLRALAGRLDGLLLTGPRAIQLIASVSAAQTRRRSRC